jgi:probable F420-dependent oxidoreductase
VIWTEELDRTHISCGAAELVQLGQEPRFFESLTTLSYVAAVTNRIRIGTAVLCLPYRHPVIAAKQIANLDVLSHGRLTLGIGVGAPRTTKNRDFEVLGVSRATKYQRTREYVAAMRTIWTDPRPSFQGRLVDFPETEIFPKPVQQPHPPLWIGGSGPKAMEMVADFGQGWLPTWLTPDEYRVRIEQLGTLLGQRGRGDVEPIVGAEIVACVADTNRTAVEVSRATVETLTAGFTVRTPDQAWRTSLIGSLTDVEERVGEYTAAGVDHFELKFIYHSLDHLSEQMEAFSSLLIDPATE